MTGKIGNSIFAVFLSFVLAFSMVPGVTAFAGSAPDEEATEAESTVETTDAAEQVEQGSAVQVKATRSKGAAKSEMTTQALPTRSPQKLNNVIENIKIVDRVGSEIEPDSSGLITLGVNTRYRYQVDFNLSSYNNNLVNGDNFTFTIPAPIPINDGTIAFTDPSTGIQIAAGTVASNGESNGGVATITLQNLEQYLEKTGGETIKDVKGTFYVEFQIREEITERTITFDTEETINQVTHRLTVEKARADDNTGRIGETNFEKRADRTSDEPFVSEALGRTVPYSARWYGRINVRQASYNKIVITDTIDIDEHAPMQFIPELLTLHTGYFGTDYEFVYDDYNQPLKEGTDYTIEYNESYTEFVLTITNPSAIIAKNEKPAAFWLYYSTSITNDGAEVSNSLKMSADNQVLTQKTTDSKTESVQERSVKTTTGGTITLDTSYSITLYKVDSETLKPLPGAVFKVTTPSGEEITLDATDEDGRTQSRQFDTSELGDGKFTVVEVTAPDGYKLNTEPFEVTVGQEGAIKTVTNEALPVTGSFTIEGTKAVVDTKSSAVEDAKLSGFKFKVEALTEGAPMVSDDDAVVVTDADGKFSFSPFNADKSMAGKSYTYRISEVETPYVDGTITMADPIEVTVAISENDRKLSFEVSGEGVTSSASADGSITANLGTINNKYDPKAKVEVPVTKSLMGARKEMADGESFQFQLLDEDMNLLDTVAVTKDDEDSILNGYVGFFDGDYFEFTRDDLGDHYYYVREIIPADATAITASGATVTYGEATAEQRADTELSFSKDGIIYDNSVQRIVVKVIDQTNGDGEVTGNFYARWELAPASTGGSTGGVGTHVVYVPSPTIYFNNRVQAEIQLEAFKVMTGRNLEAGKFTFEVKEGSTVVATGTNDADGKVVFSKIYYNGISDEGEHTYTISEAQGSDAGVTYSDASYTVKVRVGPEVPGDYSTLLAATIIEEPEEMVFTNVYGAAGSVKLEGTKTLTGRTMADDEFSFTVKEGESAVATGTSKADGTIDFSTISYTLDDVGEHVYTITEDAGSMGDVTYDTSSFEVKVNVADNGDGTLTVAPEYPEGGVAFNNVYETVDVNVTKVWVGGEGDSVTISLLADGVVEDSKTITAADGWTTTFSGLPKFASADGHEIVYTVAEDEVEGYVSEVAGSVAEGFTVTNTKKEVEGEDRDDPEEPDGDDGEEEEEPEEDGDDEDGTTGSPAGSGKDGSVRTADETDVTMLAAGAVAAMAAAAGIAVVRRRRDDRA